VEKIKKMMRRNRIKYLFLSLVFLPGIGALSQNIESCYKEMPDGLCPLLNKKSRVELLEYHKAGQGDTIQNVFGGNAVLQVFDTLNNRLVVKTTESSTMEIKVFKQAKRPAFIGLINTVCSPICQSSIQFYDTLWRKIPLEFKFPKAIDWLDKDKLDNASDIDKTWAVNVLETNFISLQFDSVNSSVVATNNSAEFLSENDRKIIQPLLKVRPRIYRLEDLKWVLQP
jgi:Protein of unknown function (DUF3256).